MAERKILLVDNNVLDRQAVRLTLQKKGYDMATAVSGSQALDHIQRYGLPHLIIIDIQMPKMDGFEFCRLIKAWGDIPIIILTVVDDSKSITYGLENFADDYILKPYHPEELAVRVKRVLGRFASISSLMTVRIDEQLAVNFSQRQAIVNNRRVALTPTEAKILQILVEHAGRILPTQYLLSQLWSAQVAEEQTLFVYIHRLRRKIEINPAKPSRIIWEKNAGYRFLATVAN